MRKVYVIIFSKHLICLEIESRKGFVAIVTGGSRGIGELISKLLVDCDITVIIGNFDFFSLKIYISDLKHFYSL